MDQSVRSLLHPAPCPLLSTFGVNTSHSADAHNCLVANQLLHIKFLSNHQVV